MPANPKQLEVQHIWDNHDMDDTDGYQAIYRLLSRLPAKMPENSCLF